MSKRNLVISILIAPLMALLIWYHGSSTPLSSAEVENLMSTIQQQSHSPGGRHDLKALRSFLESDDGQPFYTVNLYRYHPMAQYAPGSEGAKIYIDDNGRAAFDRFSKVMLPLLASHGSHPIFGSNWTHDESSAWDRIVIVKYRSRRDIAEIFANDEFAQASEHKWAALEANERLLVQGLHIPSFYLVLFTLILLVLITSFFLRKKKARLVDTRLD